MNLKTATLRALTCIAVTLWMSGSAHADHDQSGSVPGPRKLKDKGILAVVVELGPFLINSLYLSGEGPGRIRSISVEELIANQKTIWIEPTEGMSKELVALNEGNPSFQAANPPGTQFPVSPLLREPEQHRINPATTKDALYWVRGAKLEIVDEKGRILERPEFLCHSLITLDKAKHEEYFAKSSVMSPGILFNFSQGITQILFPKDYALPLNSHERLRFDYKSLNRTSDQSRHIKCRWTLYLLADNPLARSIKPLNLLHSGVNVVIGGADDPNRLLPTGCGARCALHVMGKDAPNDMLHRKLNAPFDKNEKGQEITWHWVIPPGRHSYRTWLPENYFEDQGPIRAAGAHVHPFCEEMSLIEVRPGRPDKNVFTIYSQTDSSHGIQIAHIDYLTWPNTGILLDKHATYGWEVTYNNTSGVDQDSMAFATLYFDNLNFQKPGWAL